jgi:hypothetical protein
VSRNRGAPTAKGVRRWCRSAVQYAALTGLNGNVSERTFGYFVNDEELSWATASVAEYTRDRKSGRRIIRHDFQENVDKCSQEIEGVCSTLDHQQCCLLKARSRRITIIILAPKTGGIKRRCCSGKSCLNSILSVEHPLYHIENLVT